MLCSRATVTKSGKRTGDSFSAEVPLDVQGALAMVSQATADVQVIFAAGNQSKSLIDGKADNIEVDWVERVIRIAGRDKSASLTEKRRNKKYPNRKTSDIVEDIAKDHGLTAVVTTTDDDAGKKYHQDTAHLILNRTDFESLSVLAEREGARWYVEGNKLHFEPKAQGSGSAYDLVYRAPIGRHMSANFMRLETKRNLSAARPIKVKVKSWHHRDKKVYDYTAEVQGDGEKLEFERHYPMLTQQQVEKIAKSHAEDRARHEMSLSVEMPGDLSLDVSMKINLTGTNSIFDMTYEIDQVEYEFNAGDHGELSMRVEAKSAKSGRSAK